MVLPSPGGHAGEDIHSSSFLLRATRVVMRTYSTSMLKSLVVVVGLPGQPALLVPPWDDRLFPSSSREPR